MAALARLSVIEDGGVSRDPIIPHDNGSRLPLDSSLHITTFVNVVVEEAEQVLYILIRGSLIIVNKKSGHTGLLTLQTNDATGKLPVHI